MTSNDETKELNNEQRSDHIVCALDMRKCIYMCTDFMYANT